ncbi:MAG: hypothetical protein ABGZ49_05745 [Akkermansiaceae bacterium]
MSRDRFAVVGVPLNGHHGRSVWSFLKAGRGRGQGGSDIGKVRPSEVSREREISGLHGGEGFSDDRRLRPLSRSGQASHGHKETQHGVAQGW